MAEHESGETGRKRRFGPQRCSWLINLLQPAPTSVNNRHVVIINADALICYTTFWSLSPAGKDSTGGLSAGYFQAAGFSASIPLDGANMEVFIASLGSPGESEGL